MRMYILLPNPTLAVRSTQSTASAFLPRVHSGIFYQKLLFDRFPCPLGSPAECLRAAGEVCRSALRAACQQGHTSFGRPVMSAPPAAPSPHRWRHRCCHCIHLQCCCCHRKLSSTACPAAGLPSAALMLPRPPHPHHVFQARERPDRQRYRCSKLLCSACRISPTGGSSPVNSRNWSAACPTNISSPVTTRHPASAASRRRRVWRGV